MPTAGPLSEAMPDNWSTNARETVATISEEFGEQMSSAEVAELMQAAALESSADELEAVARAAGYIATGSTGQIVVHPATQEARLARTAAATIYARLHRGAATQAAAKTAASERAARAALARWGAGVR